MSLTSILLGLVSVISLSHSLPVIHEVVTSSLAVTGNDTKVQGDDLATSTVSYTVYTGTGQQWPTIDKWVSYKQMFSNNQPILSISCRQFQQPDNTADEINDLFAGIEAAASASGVDERFILAIIMQETGGCVRAPTSIGFVNNPGLMQDHNGTATCNSNHVKDGQLLWDGQASIPCPSDQISAMILEGTSGTDSGNGLANCINTAARLGGSGAEAYYWAARIYNTGSYIAGSDLSAPPAGTSCYATDIANRLLGWAGPDSPCNLPNPY